MPLKLDFKNGSKLIINGAVLENAGANATLLVHNEAAIMRDREILTEDEAKTPASRTYFALQCAYVFPDREQEYFDKFQGYMSEYLEAAPSALDIGRKVQKSLEDGKIYKALRDLKQLIDHEKALFDQMNQQIHDKD